MYQIKSLSICILIFSFPVLARIKIDKDDVSKIAYVSNHSNQADDIFQAVAISYKSKKSVDIVIFQGEEADDRNASLKSIEIELDDKDPIVGMQGDTSGNLYAVSRAGKIISWVLSANGTMRQDLFIQHSLENVQFRVFRVHVERKELYVGRSDGSVDVFNIAAGEVTYKRTIPASQHAIMAIAFSPKQVFVASEAYTVKSFDYDAGELKPIVNMGGSVAVRVPGGSFHGDVVDFIHANETTFVTASSSPQDKNIKFWSMEKADIKSGITLQRPQMVSAVAVSLNGQALYYLNAQEELIRENVAFNTLYGKQEQIVVSPNVHRCVASLDARRFAVVYRNGGVAIISSRNRWLSK